MEHQLARIHHALLDAVAERGYAGITVRELAGRAGVSTRSFYQHYPSKEACFLGVHQSVVRRVLAHIEAAGLGSQDVAQRLRLATVAIVGEWASDPRAARLMLIDAYAAGPAALKQALLAGRSIEARIGGCLACAPDDASLSPLAAECIVAGVFSAARRCLLEDAGGLGNLADPLADWAAAFEQPSVRQIEEVGLASHPREGAEVTAWSDGDRKIIAAMEGDRGLLLAATARLVALQETVDLGMEAIASTAGISRRGFEAEFPGPEACVAATHWLYAERALDYVEQVAQGTMHVGAADLPLASLGPQLAEDQVLATLCFSDAALAGPRLVSSHHQFLDRLACIAGNTTAPADPAAEASAGALWGLLRQRVVMGRTAQLPEAAPALASLAVAPLRVETNRLSAS